MSFKQTFRENPIFKNKVIRACLYGVLVNIVVIIVAFRLNAGTGNSDDTVTEEDYVQEKQKKQKTNSDYEFVSSSYENEEERLSEVERDTFDRVEPVKKEKKGSRLDSYLESRKKRKSQPVTSYKRTGPNELWKNQSNTRPVVTPRGSVRGGNRELTEEEKREQYYESLRKERDARKNNVATDKGLIEVLVVINNNQSVLPPARIEMILAETLTIKGKTFDKGTPILAYISILNSRVMLDITNIQRTPVNVVSIEDTYDGREGLFSEVAEQIWRDYQDEQKDSVNKEISNGVEDQTNSSIVGGAINDLAGLFRKKRKRKYDKITLVNDHEVILKIDPNK